MPRVYRSSAEATTRKVPQESHAVWPQTPSSAPPEPLPLAGEPQPPAGQPAHTEADTPHVDA